MYQLLDLFGGIGGFSLGLERTGGFETVAFCEIDPFCQRVLNKHWPKVPCYDDIRTLTADTLRRDGLRPTAICGGYPCQPFSAAGKRAGKNDDRHLWPQVSRLIDELRPEFCLFENVAGHISLGLDDVLSDLEGLGYQGRPVVIPACALGAKHRRDRVWIVAHPSSERRQQIAGSAHGNESPHERRAEIHMLEPASDGEGYRSRAISNTQLLERSDTPQDRLRAAADDGQTSQWGQGSGEASGCGSVSADTDHEHAQGQLERCNDEKDRSFSRERSSRLQSGTRDHPERTPEPRLGRGFDGISTWLDGSWERDIPRTTTRKEHRSNRLKALGNAVVPQIPEMIGRAWLAAHPTTTQGEG